MLDCITTHIYILSVSPSLSLSPSLSSIHSEELRALSSSFAPTTTSSSFVSRMPRLSLSSWLRIRAFVLRPEGEKKWPLRTFSLIFIIFSSHLSIFFFFVLKIYALVYLDHLSPPSIRSHPPFAAHPIHRSFIHKHYPPFFFQVIDSLPPPKKNKKTKKP